MTDKGATRLDALTGARGIAAWFVVFYHVRSGFTDAVPRALIDVFAKGYLAVDLFFILSGFVMWLNYRDHFARDGLAAAPGFLWRRIARIYPLHFVILTAMVAFAAVLALTGRPGVDHYPFTELPLHYLLMQNWGLTPALTWNDPAWSISTELGAYLMLPLIAPLFLVRRWTVAACLAGIAMLGLALGLFMSWREAATLGHGIVSNGLLRCLFEFAMGLLVCQLWQQGTRLADVIAIGIIAALGLFWGLGGLHESFAAPGLFAALVYLLARSSAWRSNPLAGRFLTYIGEISYSTYLAHFFLWVLFKLVFVTDRQNVPLAQMGLYLVIVFATSAFLYHFVEQPGRRWMQGWKFRIPRRIEA